MIFQMNSFHEKFKTYLPKKSKACMMPRNILYEPLSHHLFNQFFKQHESKNYRRKIMKLVVHVSRFNFWQVFSFPRPGQDSLPLLKFGKLVRKDILMNEKSSVSSKQKAYSLKDEIYSECRRSASDKLEFNLFPGALGKYYTYSPQQAYCVSN
jgi:hypothetical protein